MSKQTLYSCTAVEDLLERYFLNGGDVFTLEDGILGYGLTVATAPNCKTAIIKEVPLNEWNSAHTIRLYNETPRKYAAMIAAL